MTLHELKGELKKRGVILALEGDKLRYAPWDVVDQALLEIMTANKPYLVRDLQERRVCELLHRYHLGQFSPFVRARLAKIFAENPPDALQRLLKACDALGITGDYLEQVADEAMDQKMREPKNGL